MYIVVNNFELKRIKEVEEITGTDAGIITGIDVTGEAKLIPAYNLFVLLDGLLCEYNHKVEELEDLVNDVNDNYIRKRVDEYEEYGVSKNDF